MTIKRKTKGYVVLTFEYYKEGKKWVSTCVELGTSTFGRSILDAERKLDEAVMLHLNTLEEIGERERFFKEHHIEFTSNKHLSSELCVYPTRIDAFVKPRIQPIGEMLTA
jgi:predicted RNase H-like HicB family nuclease